MPAPAAGDQEQNESGPSRATCPVRLTAAEIAHFHSHGFVVVDDPNRRLLNGPEVIRNLQEAMCDCFSGRFDLGNYPDEWHWREGLSRPDVVREICNAWKCDSRVRGVVLSEDVARLGAQLYPGDWRSVRIAQDDLVWKPPRCGSAQVGFHVDSDYISRQFLPYEDNSVTVWIPLDDADAENGILEFVGRSHAEGNRHAIRKAMQVEEAAAAEASFHGAAEESFAVTEKELEKLNKQIPGGAWPADEDDPRRLEIGVKAEMLPAGCFSIHHQDCLHGSRGNLSDRHRRALVVHLIAGEVRFCAKPGYIYGRYKLAGTDELRDEFFPVVYNSQPSAYEM